MQAVPLACTRCSLSAPPLQLCQLTRGASCREQEIHRSGRLAKATVKGVKIQHRPCQTGTGTQLPLVPPRQGRGTSKDSIGWGKLALVPPPVPSSVARPGPQHCHISSLHQRCSSIIQKKDMSGIAEGVKDHVIPPFLYQQLSTLKTTPRHAGYASAFLLKVSSNNINHESDESV